MLARIVAGLAALLIAACTALPLRNQVDAAVGTAARQADRTVALLQQDLITIDEAERRYGLAHAIIEAARAAQAMLIECDARGDAQCDTARGVLIQIGPALDDLEVFLLEREKRKRQGQPSPAVAPAPARKGVAI